MTTTEEKWLEAYTERHPELPLLVRQQMAHQAVLRGDAPPLSRTETNPADFALPLWARVGLSLGGRSMLQKMLGNKWTTAIGVLIGAGVALCQSGVLPPAWCVYVASATGLLTALGFVASKDAITGSEPGATH